MEKWKKIKLKLAKNKAGFFVGLSGAVYLFFKLKNLTFHFGDGNAYLYMADIFWKGSLPYRDYFLADPPFLVIFLTALSKFFGKHLLLFQLVPIFFEIGSAILIYLILKRFKSPLAFLGSIFYLFSFSILATSDYLTGVQVVVFLILAAILAWLKNKFFWSGLFWSLAILTKLYALAGFSGFLVFLFWKKGELKKTASFFLGGLLGLGLFLGPFLVISFKSVWQYLVMHQLNRPAGISKGSIFSFYLKREWFFILGALAGLIISRKKIIVFPALGLIIFFLIFQDLYYLYLNSFFPFLIILTILFLGWVFKKNQILGKTLIFIYGICLLFSVAFYDQDFNEKGEFRNVQEIAQFIATLPAADLYGSHEVAPIVALMTQRRLVGNYIDTNGQAFASGGQDLKKASAETCQGKAYFLAKITDISEREIEDFGFDAYFDRNIFNECCQAIKKFPDTSGNQFNRVAIYQCGKQ